LKNFYKTTFLSKQFINGQTVLNEFGTVLIYFYPKSGYYGNKDVFSGFG